MERSLLAFQSPAVTASSPACWGVQAAETASDPATQKPAGKHCFHSRGDTLKGQTQHRAPQEILALNSIFGASPPRSVAVLSDKMPFSRGGRLPPPARGLSRLGGPRSEQ